MHFTPRWLLAPLLLLSLLWQFEARAIGHAELAPAAAAPAISTWSEQLPVDTPFLLVQEVRDNFRRADAKRDAGTPVRDIAALPPRPNDAG
ncbi:hypothetical protein C2I19_09900 [Chromobacterium alticapitis]|uniref:Uncharacterized protein n=1 Tax=Chromobacterium alticapitis TaxID=2073169 RepID=A0A2S5DGA9_9NEIS|nr:hypothetical protein C2I19_09900 [Chromobacterium alticapitis]